MPEGGILTSYSPLLLSEHETPELEVCYLDETFIYTHEIIEHDHLFDTSVHDITKKIKKLLTENRHDIDKIILMPRRPELGKADRIWSRY